MVGMSGCMREEVEPIYESVSISRSPVNLFSSLVGSEETVSPDPNIYEVPPGAILNSTNLPEDSPNNITPPNGFQDDLSVRSRNGLEELSPKLEDLYSTVKKPNKMEAGLQYKDEMTLRIEEVTSDCESSLTEAEEYASASESEHEINHQNKNAFDISGSEAQITETFDQDKVKTVCSTERPEVIALDVEESVDLAKERRRVIDNQVVKKKRIDSWIKENDVDRELEETSSEEGVQIVEVTDDEETTNFQIYENDDSTVELANLSENEGEIVYDSILQNKEKTKNYWEKLMLATKMAANSMKKAGMEEPAGKVESVVEREIRLQREREEALALERQNAFKLAKYAEEGLHSIPTTDEGNYSECSEEKDQSIDSSGETEAVFNYQRTPSFESMSSGHSSGSDGLVKRKGHFKSAEEPRSEQSKVVKESPTENDRISKERKEELKPKPKPFNFNSKKTLKKVDEIRAELESISLKKCVSMSNLPLASQTDGSSSNSSSKSRPASNKFNQTGSRQNISNDAASKLFTPSKIPRGLMKRFIESHGRLPTSFILAPSPIVTAPVPKKVHVSTEVLNQTPVTRLQETSSQLRRPGYRSAEDKIQMELKEMKRREAELKKDRARLLGRSQPNLQNIGLIDDFNSDDESCSLPQMGKLRSALSNPNLTNERTVIIPKRCNELIDAWENMIQKKMED